MTRDSESGLYHCESCGLYQHSNQLVDKGTFLLTVSFDRPAQFRIVESDPFHLGLHECPENGPSELALLETETETDDESITIDIAAGETFAASIRGKQAQTVAEAAVLLLRALGEPEKVRQ